MNVDINIQIDEAFTFNVDPALIEKAAHAALDTNTEYDSFELGIIVTGDEQIHQINRQYRGIDAPTDVISFALLEGEDGFVLPPDGILHLGEVIISYQRAVEQAVEQQHSIERELAWLVVHGVLHLLGHDHQSDEDDQRMRAIEGEILEKIGVK